MKSHCIYGSDDCTKCKVNPEEGLKNDMLKESLIAILDEYMVFLETEQGKYFACDFIFFIRWLNLTSKSK